MPDEQITQLDLFKEIHRHLSINNRLMAEYLLQQYHQATETAAIAFPITFNLLNPTLPTPIATQVIPKNPRRNKVALANFGPSDVIYAEKWFDPVSILQLFNDPAFPDAIVPGFNQAIPIGYLPAGTNVTVNGVGGVWAYSLGSAAASNKNSILSIQDSVFANASDIKPADMASLLKDDGLHPSEKPGGGIIN